MNNLDYDGWYQGGVHTEHAYKGGKTETSESASNKSDFVMPDGRLFDSYVNVVTDTGTVPGDPFTLGKDKISTPDRRQNFEINKDLLENNLDQL